MAIKIYGSIIDIPALVGNPVYLEVPESYSEKSKDEVNQGRRRVDNRKFSALKMLSTRIFGERVRFS